MQTSSLTFPTLLPGLARPRSGRTRPGASLPAWLRNLKARLPAYPLELPHRVEKRLRASAARGRRIVLGTAELPYEPLVLGGAPLTALRAFADLELAITTRSPEIGEQVELLAELDQRHAVTVDMLIAACDPFSSDVREQLQAVSALTAEGITTRLVLSEPAAGDDGSIPRRAEAGVRGLFEAAWHHRVHDVSTTGRAKAWSRLVTRLRLEYGFPRRLPGRG